MRFECQPGCNACCEQQGFVYLTEDDILRLAAYLRLSPADFEKRHVYRTRNQRRLRVPRYTQCSFLVEGRCGVHEAKPTQCRTFPFWPELIESRRKWYSTGNWCPGIGKGELVQIGRAREIAEEMRAAHPHLYE
jgi:Fe-S-cluster containining protein